MKEESLVKVFYADDDEDDRLLFMSAMRQTNIPVELSCASGEVILETMLARINFDCDLVFLDLNMPGKSGLETLDSLQVPIRTNKLKVVIFSTSADKLVLQKTHLRNAVLFVQKPMDFALLVRTLKDIVRCRTKLQLPVLLEDFQFNLRDVTPLYDC